jgi:DNA-binding transcriptional ArsR family regulator
MTVSPHRASGALITPCRAHRCARAARHADHISLLGGEVIAHHLRTLGHPTRLRLMRALDRGEAGVEQLADELSAPTGAVAAHLRVLCRAAVVCRSDRGGPARYRLADWPSLWLIDQLARRMRHQALGAQAAEHEGAP